MDRDVRVRLRWGTTPEAKVLNVNDASTPRPDPVRGHWSRYTFYYRLFVHLRTY